MAQRSSPFFSSLVQLWREAGPTSRLAVGTLIVIVIGLIVIVIVIAANTIS